MHSSSLENMQLCYEKYICGDYYQGKENINVLDIGGANVNGSYSDIFSAEKFNYVAADIVYGKGVDLVLDDPYKLPLNDNSIDIVISGQAFEHVEFFWLQFEEMSRVLMHDGWIFLIAPSAGPIHQFPVDCYRFYPDAYKALAKYCKLNVVKIFLDERGPWCDLVGIFSKCAKTIKPETLEWQPLEAHESNKYLSTRSPVNTKFDDNNDVNLTHGETPYLEILKSLHDRLQPLNYLEIGVRQGVSLSLSHCQSIAIDPEPEINPENFNHAALFRMPSDHFFANQSIFDFETNPIDFAFIDGMHLFEFVLRDFINIELRSSNSTTIVIDDIFPNNEIQASRHRSSRVWTGDVWKIIICLKEYRPDLELTMINSSPTGLLIIRSLNKSNRVLTDHYNPIVKRFCELKLKDHRQLILERSETVSYTTWLREVYGGED